MPICHIFYFHLCAPLYEKKGKLYDWRNTNEQCTRFILSIPKRHAFVGTVTSIYSIHLHINSANDSLRQMVNCRNRNATEVGKTADLIIYSICIYFVFRIFVCSACSTSFLCCCVSSFSPKPGRLKYLPGRIFARNCQRVRSRVRINQIEWYVLCPTLA